jgi:hypothetical protein
VSHSKRPQATLSHNSHGMNLATRMFTAPPSVHYIPKFITEAEEEYLLRKVASRLRSRHLAFTEPDVTRSLNLLSPNGGTYLIEGAAYHCACPHVYCLILQWITQRLQIWGKQSPFTGRSIPHTSRFCNLIRRGNIFKVGHPNSFSHALVS